MGKSINLRNRLKQHLKGNNAPTKYILNSIKYIKIILYKGCVKGASLEIIETDFIKELRPMFNGAQGSLTTEKSYGFLNLRKKLNDLDNKDEIYEDIDKWNNCFIDNEKSNFILGSPIENKEVNIMEAKEGNLFLEAIKESIKLAVKHENEENADKIIYGFLSGLSK